MSHCTQCGKEKVRIPTGNFDESDGSPEVALLCPDRRKHDCDDGVHEGWYGEPVPLSFWRRLFTFNLPMKCRKCGKIYVCSSDGGW